jgi:hypothetical protein
MGSAPCCLALGATAVTAAASRPDVPIGWLTAGASSL